MNKYHAACFALIVAAGSAAGAKADVANGEAIASGENGAGAQACMQCHGAKGEGNAAAGFPRLAGMSATYLEKQLHDFTTDKRPSDVMTPIAQALSEAERRDVSEYYAQLEPTFTQEAPATDAQTLQRGQELAERGSSDAGVQACISCHGPAGTGLPPHYPSLAGQHASYLQQELLDWREGRRQNAPLGTMNVIAERLSDADIEAVSRYFASIRPGAADTAEADAASQVDSEQSP